MACVRQQSSDRRRSPRRRTLCVLFGIRSAFNDDFVYAQSVLNRLSVCRRLSSKAATAPAKIPFDIIVVAVVVPRGQLACAAAASNVPYAVWSFQRII